MVLSIVPRPTAEVARLQRAYAAVQLATRGYLDAPQSPPQLGDKDITIKPTEVSESDGGDPEELIYITPLLASPPIAAYVDGKFPLKLDVSYGNDDRALVWLSVPIGTGRNGGPVTLVWPGRTIVLAQPIRIRRRSMVEFVEFDTDEQTSGELYLSMRFVHEPIEVHIGGREIPPDRYTWDGDSHLIIHVPKETPSGPVLVLSANRVFMSPEPLARASDVRKATPKS